MTIAAQLAAWLLAVMLSTGASAQLVEGRDYLVIDPPQPAGSGKNVEVIEFFWYACPHCNSLQPPLRAWLKRKPADVEFKRLPAAFRESWLQLARTYYAIETMGLVDKLHHGVFEAIHEKRTLDPKALLNDPAPLFDWAAANGVDRQKFAETYNSFAVNSRTLKTMQTSADYDLRFTPMIAVGGRYLTAPSLGLKEGDRVNYDRYFQVLDQVIAMARKQRAAGKQSTGQ